MTTIESLPALLDASALLALLYREPGGMVVAAALSGGAIIGAANYAEVLTRLVQRGESAPAAERRVLRLVSNRLTVEPMLEEDAVRAAALWTRSKDLGLSLGDRACLALAARLRARVLTADRIWAAVPGLEVSVTLIR